MIIAFVTTGFIAGAILIWPLLEEVAIQGPALLSSGIPCFAQGQTKW